MKTDVAPVTTLPSSARNHRIFHTGIAVAFLVTTVAGFGPTYFYKPVQTSPPLTLLLSGPGRDALGNTAAWQSFARFLVG